MAKVSDIKIDKRIKDLIPTLLAGELEQLEKNILRDGCRDPLVVWKEKGILLDGHNRLSICEKHGADYKVVGLPFDSWAAAEVWVIENQIGKRNLSETQRAICAARLATLQDGQRASSIDGAVTREEAAKRFNVSTGSLDRARAVLESGVPELIAACQRDEIAISVAAEIAELDEDIQKKLAENSPEAARVAKEKKKKKAAKRKAERARKKVEALKESHPLNGERFKLYVGDLVEVGKKHIADASVDAIITDPPYPEEFLPEYKKLANLAARVLRPGGHCLVMVGQANLPGVIDALVSDDQLIYTWTLAYLTPGASTQAFGRKVKSNWKPVIWLVKGKNDWEHVEDFLTSDKNDKRFHEWGQSVGGLAQIVERFTVPKSLIFDPFLGGGSTAIAALESDRLFVGCDIDAGCVAESAKRIAGE